VTRLAVLALAVAVLAGCGGGDAKKAAAPASHAASSPGAKLFTSSGCGSCHALADAGTHGKVGPDLDQLQPTFQVVQRQVRDGGGGMPPFAGKLSATKIRELAAYVSGVTAASAAKRVSVAAAFKPDKTKLSDCKRDTSCFQQAFANLAYRYGPKSALATFVRDMRTNRYVEENCHRIAHAIGAGALTRFHGNVGEAFAKGSAACWSGYYHGILERAFQGVPDSKIATVARKLCASESIRRTAFIAYQCVHGLGHGLMIYTGYNLPKSLGICDHLATSWDQVSCTGGVFMENQSSSYGYRSKWLRKDQPLYPCTIVSERHKLYCYLMVTSQILPDVGYSWTKTVAWCRRSEAGWVRTCFQSLGRDASGQTRGDVARIQSICALAGGMGRECVRGAAADLASNDANGRRAARLCNASPAGMRAYCFYATGSILGSFSYELAGRRRLCAAITTAYLRVCLDGATARPFRG
jgi:mono/diheme cytochrome c family protein